MWLSGIFVKSFWGSNSTYCLHIACEIFCHFCEVYTSKTAKLPFHCIALRQLSNSNLLSIEMYKKNLG